MEANLIAFGQGLWMTALGVGLLAGGLTLAPRWVADRLARAPGLDGVLALLTLVPWLLAGGLGGWPALLGALLGQALVLLAWVAAHEWMFREAAGGPRIFGFINRQVGRWRNHVALWVTLIVLPVFWLVRLAQILLWPMLVYLLDFPRYRQREWINVSRHKFEGLIGHDLIWCLYCDWMTGVYALAGEMLRNVESFWCPIRFYDGKKCENCRLDFPDVDGGWVSADADMHAVVHTLEQHYGDGQRTWFGHPARLTVEGTEIEPDDAGAPATPGPSER